MNVQVKRVLDSPAMTRALQVVAALSLVIAVVVGIKQYSLASCLAEYSDESARATAARSSAAAEDRKADEADRAAAQRERDALQELIAAIASQDKPTTQAAFVKLDVVYRETAAVRAETAKTRVVNEQKRRENPPLEPATLRCG